MPGGPMPSMNVGYSGGAGAGAFGVQFEGNHKRAYLAWTSFGKYMPELAREAGAEVAEAMRAKAYEYSSGNFSYAEQRKWTPGWYSTRRAASGNDYIINTQTGRFRAGFQVARTQHGDGEATFRVRNNVRVGRWNLLMLMTLGTRRMRKRPLADMVRQGTASDIRRILDKVRHRILARMRRGV